MHYVPKVGSLLNITTFLIDRKEIKDFRKSFFVFNPNNREVATVIFVALDLTFTEAVLQRRYTILRHGCSPAKLFTYFQSTFS